MKLNYKTILTLGVVMVLTGCGAQILSQKTVPVGIPNQEGSTPAASTLDVSTQDGSAPKTYTSADVAQHLDKTSCWMAISGKVYDVTDFIPDHPGGNLLLQGCGKDATALFNDPEGEGKPHSKNAFTLLKTFYIGNLK